MVAQWEYDDESIQTLAMSRIVCFGCHRPRLLVVVRRAGVRLEAARHGRNPGGATQLEGRRSRGRGAGPRRRRGATVSGPRAVRGARAHRPARAVVGTRAVDERGPGSGDPWGEARGEGGGPGDRIGRAGSLRAT